MRYLSRSAPFLVLLAGLFVFAACDSSGSNSDDDVAGVENPDADNGFVMKLGSSKVLSKAASKYGGYAFDYGGTNPNTNQSVYVIFFTSATPDPSNFGNSATQAEVFGAFVTTETASTPSSGAYTVGTSSSSDPYFFGWIGQDFDTGDDGTRTLQVIKDGKIEIDDSGNVTNFKKVSATQVTYDLPVKSQDDYQIERDVSITLDGSIKPRDVNEFAQSSGFRFNLSIN